MPGPERRLAAIMFTDIVGSTAMTARSESAGLAMRDRHRELVRTEVKRYHGHFIEAPGDESLSTFESAVDAVDAALATQQKLHGDPELRVRIGIHLGETVFRGGEVFGDGVNIAARIRELAEPEQILVSGEVARSVQNQPNVEASPRGEHKLKGVEGSVMVHAVSGTAAEPRDKPHAVGPAKRAVKRWLLSGAAVALIGVGWAFRRPLFELVVTSVIYFGPFAGYEQQVLFATTTDDVKIAYAAVGEGPAVVIVSGLLTHLERGANGPLSEPYTPRLMHRHRVVRYDKRGCGLSDRDISDHSLEAHLRDLEAVVEALGLDRFALLGLSAGGPTAIAYAARHPESVSRLALYGTSANLGSSPETLAQWQALPAVIRAGWGRENPAIRHIFAFLVLPKANEFQLEAFNVMMRLSANAEDAARLIESLMEEDVRDLARKIRVPTLVMHVEDDAAVPLELGRELAGLIPDARFSMLPGSNHAILPSDPGFQEHLRILDDWFAQDAMTRPEPAASKQQD